MEPQVSTRDITSRNLDKAPGNCSALFYFHGVAEGVEFGVFAAAGDGDARGQSLHYLIFRIDKKFIAINDFLFKKVSTVNELDGILEYFRGKVFFYFEHYFIPVACSFLISAVWNCINSRVIIIDLSGGRALSGSSHERFTR